MGYYIEAYDRDKLGKYQFMNENVDIEIKIVILQAVSLIFQI